MKYLSILFLFCISLSVQAKSEAPLDSVGVKKVGEKYFIMHKTEKGQGLYSIARRYNTKVDVITAANPEVKDGLAVGQIVLIPTEYKEENKKTETTPKKEESKSNGESVVHVVKPGETLYAISRLYDVPVNEIKLKNKMTSNEIQVGQELLIKGTKKEHTENYGGEEKKTESPKKETPKENSAKENKAASYEYNKATGEVKESGYAIVASQESMDQKRSYALHPTAPVGTIIMVTNTSNNKSVFIRVVGNTASSDSQVILMISNASAERLGISQNDRVLVKLNYAK